MDALKSGYPRFLTNHVVARLFEEAKNALCQTGEEAMVFPSSDSCARAKAYLEKRTGKSGRMAEFRGLGVLIFPSEEGKVLQAYWQHTGEVVSSRLAEDALADQVVTRNSAEYHARLAEVMEVTPQDFYLYESGMAAIFSAYRAATELRERKKTLQLDFPYIDALKIQEQFGAGAEFLASARGEEFEAMLGRIQSREFAAVLCEVPSNPLLRSVDLPRLSAACREGGTPLLVDDTVSSHHNLEILPHVDAVTTSLTKWVSGVGNVMGGSIKLNANSAFYSELQDKIRSSNPNQCRLYARDAEVLADNASGFVNRIQKANDTGELLAEFLQSHPAVEQVWYPKYCDREQYLALARTGAGYGGLMSFSLKSKEAAPRVYDALRWSKGPSLGTEFSLACAYTLLAHYKELDWAESCGVPRELIRLSVGVEDASTLQESLGGALDLA